jgi:alkylresorcinol/alkylpyrone synthase
MPRIVSVGTALPPHVIAQEEARAALERLCAGKPQLLRLLRVFARSGVERRYLAFPLEYYASGRSFDERNADFVEKGVEIGARAAQEGLRRAGVAPERIDHMVLATTTGLATPSLDALLVDRLGMRRDVRRSPLFGLGCAGGAAAIARAAEQLSGRPRQRALAVSIELSGQVFSPTALRPVDVIGAALFGDGAAAAVLEGDETGGRGPGVSAVKSVLFEATEHVMGWRFTSAGMRLVLSEEVTDVVVGPLREAVAGFLSECGVKPSEIAHWMLHPGGRRIIDAYRTAFGLGDGELQWTRGSLARVGNLSSASVLFVLSDVLGSGRARPGDRGLMVALGPGFAAEMVLLSW